MPIYLTEYQTYNPLPKQVEIRKSPIHGYGLFAKEVIFKGILLGISHIETDISLFPHGWIRTPLGGFYNHSETPNCMLVGKRINGLQVKMLKTRVDIKEGEELTCTYTIWQATEQMKNYNNESWLGL